MGVRSLTVAIDNARRPTDLFDFAAFDSFERDLIRERTRSAWPPFRAGPSRPR